MEMEFKAIANGLHIAPSTAYRIYKQFKASGDANLTEKTQFRYIQKAYIIQYGVLNSKKCVVHFSIIIMHACNCFVDHVKLGTVLDCRHSSTS